MGQPITWRNIEAPDLRGSAALLGVSQSGINKGFEQLQGVLQQQQKVDEANWNQIKDNNTNDLRNQLFAAKTPEEAQAVQAQIMERMNSLGAQVDQNSIRTALDGRIPLLQQRAKAEIDYNNAMTDAKDDPILKRLYSLALEDPLSAAAEMHGSGLSDRGRATLAEQLRKITTENVKDTRETAKFNNDQLMAPLDRRVKEANIAQSNAAIVASNAQASLAKAHANKITEDTLRGGSFEQLKEQQEKTQKKLEARRTEGMSQNGWGSEDFTSPTGRKAVEGALKGIKDPDIQENIKNELADLATKGITITDAKGKKVKVPLSADLAIAAIEATNNTDGLNLFGLRSIHGKNAKQWIEDRFSNPNSKYYDPDLVDRYLDGYAYYTRTEEQRAAALEAQQKAAPAKPDIPKPSQPVVANVNPVLNPTARAAFVPSTADIMRQRLNRGSLRQP